MSILLTGKNGQVGFELQRALAPLGEVHAVDSVDCDLADSQALRSMIRRLRPRVIVNSAAYTAVDRAESETQLAQAINAVAPGVIGEEAAALGASVVHYSTDYVFDGAKTDAYTEEDPPAPLSAYGHSKLDGERALMRATPQHLVLRTSWVVGAHGHNFAKTIRRLATERDSLQVVNDQRGAPTSAALLADMTAHMLRPLMLPPTAQPGEPGAYPYGLYHLSAAGHTTWFDFARFVLSHAEQSGMASMRVKAADVQPTTSNAYATPARRPANSRLNTDKFQRTFGLHLPPWQTGVQHILDQLE